MSAGSEMRQRRARIILALAVFGFITFAADRASACSCTRSSVEEHLGHADVVFTGELTRIGWPWWSPWGWIVGDYAEMANVRVDVVFKGDVGRTATFTYSTDTAMCGLRLSEGSRGVFLMSSNGGHLSSDHCLFELGMNVNAIVDVLGEGPAP